MDWRKTIGAAVLSACVPLAAGAGAQPPPAPYKPPPVGTGPDYGWGEMIGKELRRGRAENTVGGVCVQ